MNMENLSIYLGLLQFLSSKPYSFQYTDLLLPLIKFIPKYFIVFVAIVNRIVILYFFFRYFIVSVQKYN